MAQGSVTRFLVQLEAGDSSAAQQEIWKRYIRRLVGLARKKLGDVPRQVEDEEDVAQSALRGFFEGAREGRFPDLNDRNNLWLILSTMTARKAINQRKRILALKRGRGRVRSQSVFDRPGLSDDRHGIEDFPDDELTPQHIAELSEECQRLLDKLDNDVLRTIAVRKSQNYTNAEIAAELGIVERTVERKLARIRKLWSEGREP